LRAKPRRRTLWRAGALLLAVSLAVSLAACTARDQRISGDPLTDLQNPELDVPDRIAAIQRAWAASSAADRESVRRPLKALVWSDSAAADLRLAAFGTLVGDQTPQGLADTREFIRLRVPTERDPELLVRMGEVALSNGWTELTTAFVRSYAREVDVPNERRVERLVIESLNPDTPIERVVAGVFLDPDQPPLRDKDMNRVVRQEAWDLLARLDPSGRARRDIIAADDLPTDAQGARTLAVMRRGLRELGVVPRTGRELRWLMDLASGDDPNADRWWREVAGVVASLKPDRTRGLLLRNLEPLRWASSYRPQWLEDDADALLSRLRDRLAGREQTDRRADKQELRDVPASLEDAAEAMRWGDRLSLLVLDVALHDGALLAELFEQIAMDRADTSTEYGGLVFVDGQGRFTARLYPPRPQHRLGDDRFVASSDLNHQSARALAQYHFHAMRVRNSRFAGPSAEDFDRARQSGRLSLVLTSLNEGELNADAYTGHPLSVDLGPVVTPAGGALSAAGGG